MSFFFYLFQSLTGNRLWHKLVNQLSANTVFSLTSLFEETVSNTPIVHVPALVLNAARLLCCFHNEKLKFPICQEMTKDSHSIPSILDVQYKVIPFDTNDELNRCCKMADPYLRFCIRKYFKILLFRKNIKSSHEVINQIWT